MKAGEVVYTRQVQSQPSMLVEAKSRIGGLPFKTDFASFVSIVADWIAGTQMEQDLINPEPNPELVADEMPADGIPVADNTEEDDEPIIITD